MRYIKSLLITLVTWAALFGGIYYFYHRIYAPPGDAIGAAIVSFLMALGIGALRQSRIDRMDAALLERAEGPPRDGERVAVAGTLEPTGAPLNAPFSGTQCVAYEYIVRHSKPSRRSGEQPTVIQDRMGIALAPCVIKSNLREIKLLACPVIDDFPQTATDKARAAAYLASAPADDQSYGRVFLNWNESAHLFDDGTGGVRRDWILTHHNDLENSSLIERAIPAGDKVCVIGNYSAEKNAIVPNTKGGGVRILRGSRDEGLQKMRGARKGDFVIAAFLLAVPPLVAWGILTLANRPR